MRRKIKKSIWLTILAVLLLGTFACGKEKAVSLANELSFSLEDVSELTISYDDEDISFFENEGEELVIREYMSNDKEKYYARVSQKKDSIQIREGKKPFFKGGFIRFVEVYLPASYSSNIKVTTTNGNIDMSGVELKTETIRVDTTSGTLKMDKAAAEELFLSSTSGTLALGEISGGQIKIETTQGNVICEKIDGRVDYTSTSGDAEFRSASGSGTYTASNSGTLSVVYAGVTGDLTFYNKNNDVDLCLPEDLDFEFEAVTKNGRIETSFQEALLINGNAACGTVGSNPSVRVKAETKNGDIRVSR